MRPTIERTESRHQIAGLVGEQQRISSERSNLLKYCVVAKQRDVNCYSREVQESLHRFSRSKCNDPLCQKCAFRSRSGGQRRMCKYCNVRVAMPRRDYCCETCFDTDGLKHHHQCQGEVEESDEEDENENEDDKPDP